MSDFVFTLPVAGDMGNQYVHPLDVTREYLRTLTNNLVFIKHCYKGYSSDNYGNADPKEGSVFLVRVPMRYKSFDGQVINPATMNTVQEHVIPVEMNIWKHVPLGVTTKDMYLYINDFNRTFIEPAALQTANDLDFTCTDLYKQVYNQVGSPGSTPDSMRTFLLAGMTLDNCSVPRDGKRWCIIDPVTNVYMVDVLKELFNPPQIISEQYRQGILGMSGGFQFEMSQNLRLHTNGKFFPDTGGIKLQSKMVEGSNTLVMYNFTGTPTINEGDIFTIANVNSVNLMNKQDTGIPQQFVCITAVYNSPSSGMMTVTVAPTVKASITDPYQNVTALGLADAIITFAGTPQETYPVNIAFHEEAFCIVGANLPLVGGVDYGATETIEGINARILRQWEVMSNQLITRIDTFIGAKCIRPEMAVRIAG
jgi:hypothetical protein